MKYMYPKSDKTLVSIIIVTHNGAEYMGGLCSSLLKAVVAPYELIVVDNGSRDATLDIIRRYFPEAKIFLSNKNIGFSRACNLGGEKACGEYLFFLNQDTEVDPRAIKSLLKTAEEKKEVGLFGAKMKFAHYPEIINSFGHAMNRIGFAWDYGIGESDGEKFSREREALGVCGGAGLIRRDLFLSLGGFDEKFFMYGEDVDLGLRVVEAGYKVMAIPEAVVFHYKNLLSGDSRHFEFLDQKNRWRIVLKNFPSPFLEEAIKGGLRFDLISLFKFLTSGEISKFFYRLIALVYTLFSLPEILAKRKNRNMDILAGRMAALLKEGRGYPEVDVGYLISRCEWSVSRAILRDNLKRERLPVCRRVLLLRGPQPEMVKGLYEILKEIYPQAEVEMLVGDSRKTSGFKGKILDFSYRGKIGYFFKLWSKIFKKYDLILILRPDAFFKKILALVSFPRLSFTIDNVGRLEKVDILRVLREANLAKIFFRSLRHFFKRVLLRLIVWLGEDIFFILGLRGKKLNKILLIQLGQLGDLVLETAAVEAIRKKFEKATIISLVGPWGEELVRRDPLIDKVMVYRAGWLRPEYIEAKKNCQGLGRMLLTLWRERIDLTIDFRGEANSIILAYLSGARLRLGYSLRSQKAFFPLEEVKFLLNLPCEYPWEKRHEFHQVEHNLRLLKKLGIEGDYRPRAFFNTEEKEWARNFLLCHGQDRLVIIHPGASRIEKTWPPQKFTALIEKLQREYNARVVIVGEEAELDIGQKIISALKEKPVLATGMTTLGKLTSLISEADLFIGNESGPMHIAASLSIPTVAIMSGVPSLYGPYKTRHRIVQKKLPCWHPWIEHCYCPDNSYRCLKEIEVEEVWKAVCSFELELESF